MHHHDLLLRNTLSELQEISPFWTVFAKRQLARFNLMPSKPDALLSISPFILGPHP